MTHDDVRDALPFYALDALEPGERDALDAHLATCADCRAALRAERVALDALARTPEPIQPRAELRARVLAVAASSAGTAGRADAPERVSSFSIPPPPPQPTAVPTWAWLALAAAALLAIGSSVGLLRARAEVRELQASVAEWQARVNDVERRAQAAAADATYQRQAIALLTSSDLVQTTLQGVTPAASARARTFLSLSQGALVMSAQGLPVVPSGRTYQLWAIIGSDAVSAGTFTTDGDGRAQLVGQLPVLRTPPAAFAVTLEPEGGVPQPTGPKYLLGTPAN